MYEILKKHIAMLKADLLERPCPSLILAAGWVLEDGPRSEIPDWVDALAGGNPEEWESVMEVAKADLLAEVAHE